MKLEDFKKFLDIAKMGLDACISVSDVRARRRVEKRRAEDEDKDKRIKELEREIAKLKGEKLPETVETEEDESEEEGGEEESEEGEDE